MYTNGLVGSHTCIFRRCSARCVCPRSHTCGWGWNHTTPCTGVRCGSSLQEDNKEGNVLFNTFYLRLYGVRHMVKNHSDSEKGNTLPPHRLLLSISSKGYFICTIPQTGKHIPLPLLHQSWITGWNEK